MCRIVRDRQADSERFWTLAVVVKRGATMHRLRTRDALGAALSHNHTISSLGEHTDETQIEQIRETKPRAWLVSYFVWAGFAETRFPGVGDAGLHTK
jgi:hypothetical protein